MDEVLRVDHVSKRFRNKEILHSLSFTIRQGICFAFIGENGAGKSTMLHILSSVIPASDGTVYVNGRNLKKEGQELRQTIGTVFQEDVLDAPLTVYQNLYYRGSMYLNSRKELQDRLEEVMEELGLTPLREKVYGTLSGGQRRLVQIARALISHPSLLLLDEPTSGLDSISRRRVWELLKRLQEQRALTIFYTTHYAEELIYADQIGSLENGILQIKGK